ncbi:MAG: hypothetical protein GY774_19990 [Planctomycetes bacterium]|nr:hypothetical protein [Planctomycetota bacterium]
METYVFDPNKAAESVKEWRRLIEAGEMTQRSPQQNKSLHKYCQWVADEMNAAGYDAQTAISLPIQLTPELVKECIFKRIMAAMYPDKESTTELSTTEMQAVYETMNAATASKFGISMQWPSLESLSEGQR